MKRITIFCGSSAGKDDHYMQQAFQLGKTLAQLGIGVVYGGAKVGLMGAVADGALSAKGEVIGVLPHFLRNLELQHDGLAQLILVDSMHERKTKMNELCDGVIALPGGFGTLEELFEILTWGQLGLHHKPVAILNTNGYYDSMLTLFEGMVEEGFLKEANRKMVLVNRDIDALISAMKQYTPPATGKWLTKERS